MLYSFLIGEKVAVVMEHWQDPGGLPSPWENQDFDQKAPQPPEHGMRMQIQRLHVTQEHSTAASERIIKEPLYRLDMFTWDGGPKGNWIRAHHHINWNGQLPTDRDWDADLQKDPMPWLEKQFKDFNGFLGRIGATDLAGKINQKEVDGALPLMLATARECAKEELANFEQARKR